MWRLVMLLSFCGFFEIYEIALTAFLSPGLIREGSFMLAQKASLVSLIKPALRPPHLRVFSSVRLCSRSWADKYGRRSVLTYSLLWYAVSTS